MRRFSALIALVGSAGTLVCCVLPALFVTLGMGAVLAGFISAFPQITWLSEHKGLVFGGAALSLFVAFYFQRKAKNMACPTDPKLAEACRTTKGWSHWVFVVSVLLYGLGAFFAFAAPYVLG